MQYFHLACFDDIVCIYIYIFLFFSLFCDKYIKKMPQVLDSLLPPLQIRLMLMRLSNFWCLMEHAFITCQCPPVNIQSCGFSCNVKSIMFFFALRQLFVPVFAHHFPQISCQSNSMVAPVITLFLPGLSDLGFSVNQVSVGGILSTAFTLNTQFFFQSRFQFYIQCFPGFQKLLRSDKQSNICRTLINAV